MNQKLKYFVISMVVLVFAAGCTTQEGVLKIGVLTPLSGPAAFIGTSYMAGVEAAVREINATGGVDGKQIQLLIEDNKNTAADGITSYQKLQISDPALLISTTSAASVAVSPLANKTNTPVLFSVVFANVLSFNENAVSFFPTAQEDAKTTIKDMLAHSVKTVGILYLNSEYGKASADAFTNYAQSQGITVVATETFTGDQTDYSTPYLKLSQSKTDALYVVAINYIPLLSYVQSQKNHPALYVNLIPAFGGLLAKSPSTFEGVHITTSKVSVPATEENAQFVAKLGNSTVGIGYASIGYDSIHAIAAVFNKNPDASTFVNTFSNFGALQGVNGEFQLTGREVSTGLVPAVFENGTLQLS